MPKIQLEIDSCNKCPKARCHNEWSSDGWDRMSDWLCTELNQNTGVCVDVGCSVPVPDFCPLRVDVPIPELTNLRERAEAAQKKQEEINQEEVNREVNRFFERAKPVADAGKFEYDYYTSNIQISKEAQEIIESRGVKLKRVECSKVSLHDGSFFYRATW